jgi:hypothetical protein
MTMHADDRYQFPAVAADKTVEAGNWRRRFAKPPISDVLLCGIYLLCKLV